MKKKFIKALYFLPFLLMADVKTVKGQGAAVVSDPGSYAYLMEQVQVSTEQAATMKTQISMLQQARQAVEKVSNSVRQLQLLDQIIQNQQNVIQNSRASYASLEQSNLFTPTELSYILTSYSNVVSQSETSINMAKEVSQDNLMQMSDAERLNVLTQTSNKTAQASNDITVLDEKYQRAKQKKLVQKIFGNSN